MIMTHAAVNHKNPSEQRRCLFSFCRGKQSSMGSAPKFPVDLLKPDFLEAAAAGKVVLTSPTGSGKSTQVPRWCTAFGRVLVVEPRRVACIGLADWVASLEQTPLGGDVGYAVRDDHRMTRDTRIVFATPGTVLQWLSRDGTLLFDAAVVDEFHERGLETDLVLALLCDGFDGPVTIMSAAMNAERIAEHLDARLLSAEGRLFPVSVRYIDNGTLLPSTRMLPERVRLALHAAKDAPGDILLFLPGKGEINWIENQLPNDADLEVLKIHGSLRLKDQARIFTPSNRRRLILATNVAETSITVPNIGVVIDSGLVKRTRYIKGRGYLSLSSIAADSALQRTGRAGRLQAGVCYRLWSEKADLVPYTAPEIHRESLTSLVLASAACRANVRTLPFADSPKPYAVQTAVDELRALSALDDSEKVTERGRRLFGFPLAPTLGSLLIEAERGDCLEDAVDLAAALAPGRPLFEGARPEDPTDDLRIDGCDASALIRAVRFGEARRHRLNHGALDEARAASRRLRRAFSLDRACDNPSIDRRKLVRAALRSDPSGACVVRIRKGQIFLADGQSEIALAKESAVDATKCEAVFVFMSTALSSGYGKDRIIAGCAMPLTFRQLAENGIGEERVTTAATAGNTIEAEVSRIFAGCVIDTREVEPGGEAARQAATMLFVERRIFPRAADAARLTLHKAALACAAVSAPDGPDLDLGHWQEGEIPLLEQWAEAKFESLGLESGGDLAMLTAEDLTPPPLPEATLAFLEERFPDTLRLGNLAYRLEYDFRAKEVTMVQTEGPANQLPSPSMLPAFRGYKVKIRRHSKVVTIR